jgi:hypothetical protein
MRHAATNRRTLLNRGATAVGTVTLGPLAGCASSDLLSHEATSAGLPAYATWLPAPERVFRPPSTTEDLTEKGLRRNYRFEITGGTQHDGTEDTPDVTDGMPTESLAHGRGFSVEGKTTRVRSVFVFDSPSLATTEQVDTSHDTFSMFTDVVEGTIESANAF